MDYGLGNKIALLKELRNLEQKKWETEKALLLGKIEKLQSELNEIQSKQTLVRDGGHLTPDGRPRCITRCAKPFGHRGYCKLSY
jgi:hypothetical protein